MHGSGSKYYCAVSGVCGALYYKSHTDMNGCQAVVARWLLVSICAHDHHH